jgi:hypothetical protein
VVWGLLEETRGSVKFSGHHYDPKIDKPRLSSQIRRVLTALEDRPDQWLTVVEIADIINLPGEPYAPENSIQAQIRNLRKPANGYYIIKGRYRDGTRIFEYQFQGQREVDVVQAVLL